MSLKLSLKGNILRITFCQVIGYTRRLTIRIDLDLRQGEFASNDLISTA